MWMLDLERKKECEKERSKRERRGRTVKKYLFSNNTIEHNTHSDEMV